MVHLVFAIIIKHNIQIEKELYKQKQKPKGIIFIV